MMWFPVPSSPMEFLLWHVTKDSNPCIMIPHSQPLNHGNIAKKKPGLYQSQSFFKGSLLLRNLCKHFYTLRRRNIYEQEAKQKGRDVFTSCFQDKM